MSYQTSIHFNPTALLTIKTEVDNSIKQVESAVATLVEEQQLPFGIDDALLQLEQCSKILYLIDQPKLGQITEYCAELMRKIMAQPENINLKSVEHLSEGTSILKRYIEFSSLKEVNIPHFLLESLNRLELSLGKPLTREGDEIKPFLECVSSEFDLPKANRKETSTSLHLLYKLCLKQLLATKNAKQGLNLEGFKIVGTYLAGIATDTPSAQYWTLVSTVFSQLQNTIITLPRLRVFVGIEKQVGEFLANPNTFQPSTEDLADILRLCLAQEDQLAEKIRQKLNLGDDILSDTQLHLFRKQLAEPDYDTVKAVTDLLSEDITTLHKEVEFNYSTLSDERALEIKQHLQHVANILLLLNLQEVGQNISHSSQQINNATQFKNETFAQSLMDYLLQALNDLGLYVRTNRSVYLQYPVNNKAIALDRLDNAYETLVNELQALVELSTSTLTNYANTKDETLLENLPNQFKEMGGALFFFAEMKNAQAAFNNCAKFLEENKELEQSDIQNILNVCASADILIQSVRDNQPIMFNMFDVALNSSQQLKSAA